MLVGYSHVVGNKSAHNLEVQNKNSNHNRQAYISKQLGQKSFKEKKWETRIQTSSIWVPLKYKKPNTLLDLPIIIYIYKKTNNGKHNILVNYFKNECTDKVHFVVTLREKSELFCSPLSLMGHKHFPRQGDGLEACARGW